MRVLHSGLTEVEREQTWQRVRLGLSRVLLGTRSSVFTPIDRLGLIVVDEEHDSSYKQTPPVPPPYYHTRDAAVALGRDRKSVV